MIQLENMGALRDDVLDTVLFTDGYTGRAFALFGISLDDINENLRAKIDPDQIEDIELEINLDCGQYGIAAEKPKVKVLLQVSYNMKKFGTYYADTYDIPLSEKELREIKQQIFIDRIIKRIEL